VVSPAIHKRPNGNSRYSLQPIFWVAAPRMINREIASNNTLQSTGLLFSLTILFSLPLLLLIFVPPGLQDYPNHLARAFILLNSDDPLINQHYQVVWDPLPNLGWDIWAIGVGRVFSLDVTGRLFLLVGIAITVSGCFALNRAIVGRWTAAPILMFPFLFNAGFTRGFLSFDLGIGLALWAIVWWTSLDEKAWRLRLAVATLLCTMLYIVHLYAWSIYGLFVLGWSIEQMVRSGKGLDHLKQSCKALLRDGVQIAPTIVLASIACFRLLGHTGGITAGFHEFEAPFSRLSDLDLLIDVGAPMRNDALIVTMTATIIAALLNRDLRIRPGLAVTIMLCVFAFFVLPGRLEGTQFVSWRAIYAGLLFLIASLEPTNKFARSRLHWTCVVTLLVTFVIVGLEARSWIRSEQAHSDFSRLIDSIPNGSALFVAHSGIDEKDLRAREIGLYHVASYAVIEKQDLVQSLFTFTGQQPVQYRSPELQSAPEHSVTFLPEIVRNFKKAGIDFDGYLAQFDYLILHGENDAPEESVLPMRRIRLINRSGAFRLYQVVHEAPEQTAHARQ